MGMYDTFYLPDVEPITPVKVETWQSKDLECDLSEYRILFGVLQRKKMDDKEYRTEPVNGIVYVTGFPKDLSTTVTCRFKFEEGRVIEVDVHEEE